MKVNRSILQKAFSTGSSKTLIQLKHLPYEMGALEPVISGHLMDFHYGKHHRTYVNNLNNLVEQANEAQARKDVKGIIDIQKNLKFNGGGHLNHEFFWDSLCPIADSHRPDKDTQLEKYIVKTWGSIDHFISRFNILTAGIHGSGWGWLVYHKT